MATMALSASCSFVCTDGHIDTVGCVAVDQHPDLVARSMYCWLPMVTLTLLAIVLFNVASLCCRLYRGTLLPIFGGTLSLSINRIIAPVSTGLLSLLALSVVEA
jgi:hypothetical protein